MDPTLPLLDTFVLKNVGLLLPWTGKKYRLNGIVAVHSQLANWYAEALSSPYGLAAVVTFDKVYPDTGLTDVKKLVLVLWQMR